MVHLAVVRIFVGYCQHLVLVQGTLERDVTQGTIQRIFAGGQQTRGLDLLIVDTSGKGVTVEVPYDTKRDARLVDLTEVRRIGLDVGIEVIGIVIRCRLRRATPVENRVVVGFS